MMAQEDIVFDRFKGESLQETIIQEKSVQEEIIQEKIIQEQSAQRRQFSCPHCPKECVSSSNLTDHIRVHTGI